MAMMVERHPRFFDFLVWPAVALSQVALLICVPTLSFLALYQFRATELDLGLIGAAGAGACAVACPVGAWLGRRFRRRGLMVAGSLIYATWPLMLSLTGSVGHLVLTQIYQGLGSAALWPNLEAELARGRGGPLLRKRLSIFNFTWCAGTAVGPLLGALFHPDVSLARTEAGRQALNLPFYAALVPGILMVVLIALWRIRVPSPGEAAVQGPAEAPHDPVRLRAFRLMAYVANFTCYIAMGVLRSLYEALAADQWAEENPVAICFWLLAAMAVAGTATFAVMYFAHGWAYRLKRYGLFLAAVVASLVVIALSRDVAWAAAGFVVFGVATAFIYSGSLYYSVEGQGDANHMAGWHEAIIAAGMAGGLLMSGLAPGVLKWLSVGTRYWQIRSPYLLAGLLFAVGIVVQVVLFVRLHRRLARRSAAAHNV